MSRFTRLVLLLCLVPTISGCIAAETLIRLSADGSGTLEQTMLLNMKTMEELPMMVSAAMGGKVKSRGSAKASIDPADLFSETRARAEAERLGRGVRFVSSTPLSRGDMQGARMVFAFEDVNALSVAPMSDAAGAGGGKDSGESLDLRLVRQQNGNMLLTANLGGTKVATPAGPKNSATKDDMPPGMEDMIAQLIDGLRVVIEIEVDGTIVRTSSPYVTGSRVSLLDVDFAKLANNPEALRRLGSLGPSMKADDLLSLPSQLKGVRVSRSPLTIEFAGR